MTVTVGREQDRADRLDNRLPRPGTLPAAAPRWIAGLAVGSILVVTPAAPAPLGSLSSPFALLIVLPALVLALEAFGWRQRIAAQLRRIEPCL